jgi:hypothetical protein
LGLSHRRELVGRHDSQLDKVYLRANSDEWNAWYRYLSVCKLPTPMRHFYEGFLLTRGKDADPDAEHVLIRFRGDQAEKLAKLVADANRKREAECEQE